MFSNAPLPFSIATIALAAATWFAVDGKLHITLIFGAIGAVCMYWAYLKDTREKTSRKEQFLENLDLNQLRIAQQNPNVVYRVLSESDETVEVKVIWSGQNPVEDGKIFAVTPQSIVSFNREAFLNLV